MISPTGLPGTIAQSLNIAFTFDTKQMSEQFDAAFRQAIRLCRAK